MIGIKCIGILWNTVNHLKDEILTDIQTVCNVIDVFECNLEDKYDDLIKEIYKNDGIEDLKIALKLDSMKKIKSKKIIIVFLDIDDSEKYYNVNKNKVVSKQIEMLKSSIRNKYSLRIDNYFFDNVFDMNDNDDELVDLLSVLRIWLPEVYEKYINQDSHANVKIRKKEKNENK